MTDLQRGVTKITLTLVNAYNLTKVVLKASSCNGVRLVTDSFRKLLTAELSRAFIFENLREVGNDLQTRGVTKTEFQ